jgi:hypothetical protein
VEKQNIQKAYRQGKINGLRKPDTATESQNSRYPAGFIDSDVLRSTLQMKSVSLFIIKLAFDQHVLRSLEKRTSALYATDSRV